MLVHCHTGCSAADIVAAVGLELRDLYSEALPAGERRQRAVRAYRRGSEANLNHEMLVLAQTLGNRVADRQIARRNMPPEWVPMPNEPMERELLAAKRVMRLLPMIYGRGVVS